MKKMMIKFRSLFVETHGNGEIVAVLVAVGIAVTLGLAAVTKLGQSAQSKANAQGSAITALPGN